MQLVGEPVFSRQLDQFLEHVADLHEGRLVLFSRGPDCAPNGHALVLVANRVNHSVDELHLL